MTKRTLNRPENSFALQPGERFLGLSKCENGFHVLALTTEGRILLNEVPCGYSDGSEYEPNSLISRISKALRKAACRFLQCSR